MNLLECLKKTTQIQYKKINKEYSEDKLTEEQLAEEIINSIPIKSITFSNKEFECLFNLKNNKKIDKIEKYLINMGYIYKIKDEYVLPEEIKFFLEQLEQNGKNTERLALIVSFYLLSNGMLKLDKLIELIDKSGIKITKDQIKQIIKDDNYIFEKGNVYLNMAVKTIIKDEILSENFSDYKVFDLKEIIDIVNIKEKYFPKELRKILKNKISDDNQLKTIAIYLMSSLSLGMDASDLVDELSKEKIIKLSKKEKESLIEFLNEISDIIPIWTFGGYSYLELTKQDKERNNLIKKMSFKENIIDIMMEIYNYIIAYTTINGVIDINDLVNILNKHHNLEVTKENVLGLIEKDEDNIDIYKNYLNILENDKEIINILMKNKKLHKEYKIIHNPEATLDEFDKKYDEIISVLDHYKIKGEVKDIIPSIIQIEDINEEMLESILTYYKTKMNLKQIKELSKELNAIKRQLPSWKLNGFKPGEINNHIQTKTKIGRNDLCPCGSGLKYKKCCGK